MNKTKMRAVLEEMLSALDEDADDIDERPHHPPTAASILEELRASRRMLAEAFRQDPPAIRASVSTEEPPVRKTFDAAAMMRLRKTADEHDYRYQKWQGLDTTHRIAAKLEAELDPSKDLAASSPGEMDAAIAAEMAALRPPTPPVSIDATTTARRGGLPDTSRTRMQRPGEPLEWFYDRSYKRDY